MLQTLLVIALVILSILIVALILLQPDRSRGMAKTASVLDQEKEGIEIFTEYVVYLFLFIAIIYNIIR